MPAFFAAVDRLPFRGMEHLWSMSPGLIGMPAAVSFSRHPNQIHSRFAALYWKAAGSDS
jgi:hypothetical protein